MLHSSFEQCSPGFANLPSHLPRTDETKLKLDETEQGRRESGAVRKKKVSHNDELFRSGRIKLSIDHPSAWMHLIKLVSLPNKPTALLIPTISVPLQSSKSKQHAHQSSFLFAASNLTVYSLSCWRQQLQDGCQSPKYAQIPKWENCGSFYYNYVDSSPCNQWGGKLSYLEFICSFWT